MDIKRFRFMILIMLIIMVIACDNPVIIEPSGGNGEWLVMVYIDADGDLDSNGVEDINEMEYGLHQLGETYSDNVRIVAMLDRSKNWFGTRVFEIAPDEVEDNDIVSPNLSMDGVWDDFDSEQEMGKIETLSTFIGYCAENYSGYDNHALILWGHGDGAKNTVGGSVGRGIGLDSNNPLYISEIQEALSEHYSDTDKLNVLGFDSCYMGMVEIAYEFRNLAEYMIGSSFTISPDGWNYSKLISGFYTGEVDTRSSQNLANYFSDVFRQDAEESEYTNVSVTAVDLSKMEPLRDAINAWAEHVATEDIQSEIETIRDDTLRYYSNAEESKFVPYYDLGVFCDNIQASSLSTQIKDLTIDINTALVDAIEYTWGVITVDGQNETYSGDTQNKGLAIVFPRGDLLTTGPTQDSYYTYTGWWYTSLKVADAYADEPNIDVLLQNGYGMIDFCEDTNSNGIVETWKELFEYYYDADATPTDYYTLDEY